METWMDELEKAVRRAPDMDEQDGDGDGDDEGMACAPPMKKAANSKGVIPPADNGDDDTEGGTETTAGTLDEVAPQRGGKKQNLYPATAGGVKKSLTEGLSEETVTAIDASEILKSLTTQIEVLNSGNDVQIAELRAEVAGLTKGLSVIGSALVKSLEQSNVIAKSLSAQVEELGRQPAGRKSTVRKIEKSFGAEGTQNELPNKEQRMQKSLAAIKAGTISPVEASLFESACNRGEFRTDLWRKMGGE